MPCMTMVSGLEEQLVGEDRVFSVSDIDDWVCKSPVELWMKMEGGISAGCGMVARFVVGKDSSWEFSTESLGVELVSMLIESGKPGFSIQEVTSQAECRRIPTLPTEPTSESYSATGVSMGML